MKRSLLTAALALAVACPSLAQTLTMGPHASTYLNLTRGYFFTAPVDMTITGVQVLRPTGSSNLFQNFAIVRFDNATPPPVSGLTTNAFTQEALGLDLPQNSFRPVNVSVTAGDVIGVYGNTTDAQGITFGTTSYSASVQQTGDIAGVTVDLFPSGMQTHLGTATTPAGMMDIFASTGTQISRVEFTYTVVKLGTPFCDPAAPNTTGVPTELSGSMGSGVGTGLHLEASAGPPNEFAYFLIGSTFADPGIPLSNGQLCVSGQIGRYNVTGSTFNSLGQFNASGVFENQAGTSTSSGGTGYDVPVSIPISGTPTITPGSTWSFQLWHREPAGASNFSNGLTIQF